MARERDGDGETKARTLAPCLAAAGNGKERWEEGE